MKKITACVMLSMITIYGTTLTVFSLRYLWFSVETIPAARILVGFGGLFVWGIIAAFYFDIAKPFKEQPLTPHPFDRQD